MALTVYQYPACSTCRKALKWLDEQGIAHERVHIVEQPPSQAVLARALDQGLPLRALFNTSGLSYREGNFKERLPTLSREQALAELAKDGKLIKRPFVAGERFTLVGFHEADWKKALT
ncbi:MAG: arsenate reductase related protein [Myxococcaceae bacterium]|nr:arsenate reductase related protein [Myxococcaceae bacterium]